MDLPYRSGSDPLAQPTRAELFATLGELRRPTTTAELARRIGRHPNGVRDHLRRLEGAGLLVRTKSSPSGGRPADAWAIAPGAEPGGEAPSAYGELGRWLARAIRPDASDLGEVAAAGRQIGGELARPLAGGDPEEAIEAVFSALGYRPVLDHAADGALRCRLCNCPYRDSVSENPELVCTLHRGITAGLVESIEARARLRRFDPAEDPRAAGCVIEIEGLRAG